MKVGDICTREIVFVDREESLQRAAQLMREHHVGALVVTQPAEGGADVLGIVTDRDIAVEAVAAGADVQRVGTGRIATPMVATVPADADIGEAVAAMKERGVRRLLVSAPDGRLHGIVAIDDVVAALGHEVAGLAHALRKGIEREAAERKPIPAAVPPAPVRVPAYRYA